MLKFTTKALVFTLLTLASLSTYGQGIDCNSSEPFCTGTTPSFPNSTTTPSLGPIGCLGSSPNPAWFFMEIDQPGPMTFSISQTDANGSGLDVDFILWGPFPSLANACASNLLSNSGVDCSYSAAANETANIPNAQPGEVYVLLLTNFSGQPGTITFSQTGGTGSADCSLLCGITGFTAVTTPCVPATNTYGVSGTLSITNPPATGTLTISNSCGGSTVFNAPFAANINYNFPGLLANGAGCTISATWSADPTCNTTTPYTAPAPCNVVACIINSLTANAGAPACPAATFSATGTVTFTNAPATGTLTVSSSCGGSQVFNAPFVSPLNYTLTGLPANGANCTVTAVFSATPACTANAAIIAPTCPPCAITSLTATGGAPNCTVLPGTYSISGQVAFTNAPASGTLTVSSTCGGSQVFNAPFVSPLNYTLNGLNANGAACTVTAVFSAAGACTANANITAPTCPTVNAGPDQVICPGDCVTLNGTATGATSVVWTPATGLSNPNIINPQACPAVNTTYTLTGTFLGPSVITNGNFSGGNTGFTSAYTFTPPPNTSQSQYFVGPNAQVWNGGMSNAGDHTSGAGNFMMVNGSNIANVSIWCQTVTVTPGTTYEFSAWVNSLFGSNYPILQFSVNGVPIGANFTPAGAVGLWEQFATTWNSGASTTATICIVNQNTNILGNDFGIDDISFAPVLTASDQVTVTISGQLNATITPAGPFCQSAAAVNLTAVDPGGTWSGPGITNAATGQFTPSVAGPGTHTIQYLIPGSCGDTSTVQIQIIPSSDATITASGPYCILNAAVNLTAVDPGGTWTGTGITSAANGTFNPAVAGVGTHTITYTINGVCGDVGTTNITVNGQTPATVNPAGPFCVDAASVNLSAVTTGGTWSGIGITNAATGTFSPATAGPGTHTITYISAGNCSDTGTTIITVNPLPTVNFVVDINSGCTPVCVTFTDNSSVPAGTISTWNWDFGDGASGGTQNPSHCYINPLFNTQQYSVSLTATTQAGCSASQTVSNMVSAYGIPDADFTFGPQPTTLLYPEISFTNLSLGANSYIWDFAGLGTSTQQNPIFVFPSDSAATYNVCLAVSSGNNCVDTTCHTIVISEQFSLYVPNAFTPNGDGTNDIFFPVANGIDAEKFEFFVFNRWGEVVFRSEDASKGWDGTHNGIKAKQDVYVWKIKTKDASNSEKKIFYGHVSLLR